MLGLVLATLTTTWSYAGFVADPPRPPASTPTAPDPAPGPLPLVPTPPAPTVDPSTPPAIPSVSPAPTMIAIRYRMADVSGQVWEHADPSTLQAFVLERNALLVRPQRFVGPFRFVR